MRQDECITVEDKKIQHRVKSFRINNSPLRTSHLIVEPLPLGHEKSNMEEQEKKGEGA
jgi:hypothetical protein